MSRLVHRPMVLKLKDDEPSALVDRDFTHVIAHIVDSWTEEGAWWVDEPSHHVFTVVTTNDSLYDIERVGADWFIYRVWNVWSRGTLPSHKKVAAKLSRI